MAWVEKRGAGRWRVCANQPHGAPHRYSSGAFPTKRAALAHSLDVAAIIATGRRYEPPRSVAVPQLSETLRAYLVDCGRTKRPKTVETYTVWLTLWDDWARANGVTLGAMSRQILADYWDHQHVTRGLSIKAANNYVRAVQRWWAWAYDHDDYGDHVPRARTIDLPAPVRDFPEAAAAAVSYRATAPSLRFYWSKDR